MHARRPASAKAAHREPANDPTAADSGTLRVAVCFGTRPEIIKLFPVIRELRHRLGHEAVRLICTDQHAELIEPVLGYLGPGPVEHLAAFDPDQPLSSLAARVIDRVGEALRLSRPDVVMVQGDTVSTFGAALAAFYAGIPVVHVEAGIRTHDVRQPFPEELHREATARIATLHLAPTERAAENLAAESVAADDIVVTGNTGQDAVRLVAPTSSVPELPGLDPTRPYAVATIHRRESTPVAADIGDGLREGARRAGIQLVVVLHPNPAISPPLRARVDGEPNIVTSRPLPYGEMLGLLRGARFVVTDSGGLQEEAAALGVPALVVRQDTDRPESVQDGNAVLVPRQAAPLADWIARLASDDDLRARMAAPSGAFGDGFAAARAVDAIVRRFGAVRRPA